MSKSYEIQVLAYSLEKGGAAKAAEQISEIYESLGFSVSRIVPLSSLDRKSFVREPSILLWLFLRVISHLLSRLIFYGSSTKCSLNLFSHPSAKKLINTQNLHRLVNLHWIANDTLSISDMRKIPDGSIITLHDEWWFQGVAHYGENNGFSPFSSITGIRRKLVNLVDSYVRKAKTRSIASVKDILVIAPSKWLFDRAASSSVFANCRLEHLPNPIDVDTFRPFSNDFELGEMKTELGIRRGSVVLCFGADFSGQNSIKGGDLLLGLLSEMNEILAETNIDLIVFGGIDVPDEEIESLRIHNVGMIQDKEFLRKIYAVSDILLFFSKSEAFGLVPAEALSCGTPVLAFNNTGACDFVIDNQTGFIVDTPDINLIVEKLKDILIDRPSVLREMRPHCRKFMVENFSIVVVREMYKKLLTKIIFNEYSAGK